MRRNTLGESDTDLENNTTLRLDATTQSVIENPYNQQSNTTRLVQAKSIPAAPPNANRSNTIKGAARRKMTYRQRERKQIQEIIKLQKSTRLLIPKFAFARLVREISLHINPDIRRYTLTALEALQEATEMYVTQVLEDAYLLTMHRNCVTLSKADMVLIRAFKLNF
ncbi:histone H3.Y-like [Cochliomyia hominivorax]